MLVFVIRKKESNAERLSRRSIPIDVSGKRVLVRVDLNVPMKNGKVTDATRIERAAPTLEELADKGAKVIVLSHFGRPDGKRVPEMSLKPLVEPLAQGARQAGRLRRGLHRPAGRGGGDGAEAGRCAAAGEPALPQGGGEERPGLRRQARGAGRHLRQRRLLRRASRARLDRGRRPSPARAGRPADAGRARGARQGAGHSQAAGLRRRRRRQGLDQARPAGQSRRQGRQADHRRRHGQHLPAGAGHQGRQVAGARRTSARRRCEILDKAKAAKCTVLLPVDAVVAGEFKAGAASIRSSMPVPARTTR